MAGMKEEKIWKDQQFQDQMVEKIFLNYAEVAKLSRSLLDKVYSFFYFFFLFLLLWGLLVSILFVCLFSHSFFLVNCKR